MKDKELLEAIKSSMAQERKNQAQFLSYLSEVDLRRLYLPQYTSLFQFCVKELGLSEASTCKRIQVARLSRKYPDVLERIAAGKLTLTNASLIAPQLKPENHQELFNEAEGKSKYEVQKIVATLSPSPAIFASECKPISAKRSMFVFSGDDELVEMYRALQDRLRHKYPKGELEQIEKEAFGLLLEKTNPAREPKRKLPPKAPIKHSRSIPAHVRRLVWQRDGGTCRQTLPSGIRCGSKSFLQIDHIVPWSIGGSSLDPTNLRLLCAAHNLFKGGARAI